MRLAACEGVHCYDPKGDLLGKILVPEVVGNVCFRSLKRNRLNICGTTSLCSVPTHVNGAQQP
jgi:gluconolactonase